MGKGYSPSNLKKEDGLGSAPDRPLHVDVGGSSITIQQANIDNSGVEARLEEVKGKLPAVVGAWDYKSGVDGQVQPIGRVQTITASAGPGGATITINGGDSIAIPPGKNFSEDVRGNLLTPTIEFTGTNSYFVSFVA